MPHVVLCIRKDVTENLCSILSPSSVSSFYDPLLLMQVLPVLLTFTSYHRDGCCWLWLIMVGYGDGTWKNQGLFTPLQNIRTCNLPLWQRKPNRRTYTWQVPDTEYTTRITQTKCSKNWELASKQTRANIKTLKIIFIVYKIDKLWSSVRTIDYVQQDVQSMYNENCKGNPLIVMVTASPTTNSTKCRMKHVVLLPCNGACLINNIKKKKY